MPCMCGDTRCWSCGPAQGNIRCPYCGMWSEDDLELFGEEEIDPTDWVHMHDQLHIEKDGGPEKYLEWWALGAYGQSH